MRTLDRFRNILEFNLRNRERWLASRAQAIGADSLVLDAGSGPGVYWNLFRHCRYFAVDLRLSESLPSSKRARFILGDVMALPFRDGAFDTIISTEVLEHVAEPVLALREFARTLRRDGMLFVTTPLGSGIHMEPSHFYGGFTPYFFERFLSQLGFADIRVTANRGFFMHYAQESARIVGFLFSEHPTGLGRITRFPLYVLASGLLKVLIPLACSVLDRFYDSDRRYTVGYFVEARRVRNSATVDG